MEIKTLTIFTPTYNRSKVIIGLFDSIVESMKNLDTDYLVEWMIVDDGSTESYSELLDITKTCQIENLSFNYVKKENGGKHTSFNYAIDNCKSDLFICIDDDDRLVPNALNIIFTLGNKYVNKGYGGFVGRVVDPNNNLLGKTVFEKELISNTIEIRDKYHFWGEPEIYYTNVLSNYHFDVFKNERFLTEAYLFDTMSLEHPFVYTNEVLMVKEYLDGGLTANGLRIRIKSPIGAVQYYSKRVERSKGIAKIKARINKVRFNYWLSDEDKVKLSFADCLIVPFAFIMYKRDKKRVSKL